MVSYGTESIFNLERDVPCFFYAIFKVNEYDGCPGVCGIDCNYETEDWWGFFKLNNFYCHWLQSNQSTQNLTLTKITFKKINQNLSRCEYGYDSDGCWMGAWCQDKGMGGCPVHDMGEQNWMVSLLSLLSLMSCSYGWWRLILNLTFFLCWKLKDLRWHLVRIPANISHLITRFHIFSYIFLCFSKHDISIF